MTLPKRISRSIDVLLCWRSKWQRRERGKESDQHRAAEISSSQKKKKKNKKKKKKKKKERHTPRHRITEEKRTRILSNIDYSYT